MRTSGCKRRNLHLVHVLLLLLWCTVHCVQARSGRRLSRSVTVKSDKRSISLDNLNELAQVVELATAPLPTPPSEEAINPLWVPDETSERLMLKRADADQEPLIKSLVEKELTKRLASFQRLISKSLFADHSGLYRTERAGAKQRAPIAPDDESKRATLNNDQSLDYLTTENPDFDDYESPVHMKQQDGEDEGMMQTMLNYFRGWSLTPFESKQDRRIRELMESVAQLKKRSHYNG